MGQDSVTQPEKCLQHRRHAVAAEADAKASETTFSIRCLLACFAFYLFWLCWILAAACAFSSWGEQGLLSTCSAWSSQRGGFSSCAAQALERVAFNSCSSQALGLPL